MSKFSVGDKVRRLAGGSRKFPEGELAIVREVYDSQIRVEGRYSFWEDRYFDLVERAPVSDSTEAVVPTYYAFPGGVRVHHISGHLTSFGGQALQYIARSTRLDGQNKGDTVENLEKAIRFLQLEIERIKA